MIVIGGHKVATQPWHDDFKNLSCQTPKRIRILYTQFIAFFPCLHYNCLCHRKNFITGKALQPISLNFSYNHTVLIEHDDSKYMYRMTLVASAKTSELYRFDLEM